MSRDTVYSEEWLAERLSKMKHKPQKGNVAEAPQRTQQLESTPSKKDYKAELVQQLNLVKIPLEPEFYFALPRKWRSDWRVTNLPVLIEFEGGLFHSGKRGHSSVSGILRDIEKYNTATINGWIVVRVTPKHVVSGQALQWIEAACAKARQQIETVKKARKAELYL